MKRPYVRVGKRTRPRMADLVEMTNDRCAREPAGDCRRHTISAEAIRVDDVGLSSAVRHRRVMRTRSRAAVARAKSSTGRRVTLRQMSDTRSASEPSRGDTRSMTCPRWAKRRTPGRRRVPSHGSHGVNTDGDVHDTASVAVMRPNAFGQRDRRSALLTQDVTVPRSMPMVTPNSVGQLYSSRNGSRNAVAMSPATTATHARRVRPSPGGDVGATLETAHDRSGEGSDEEHETNEPEPQPEVEH